MNKASTSTRIAAGLLCLLLAALGLTALVPALASPLSRLLGIDDRDALSSLATMLFVLVCLSAGAGFGLVRATGRRLPGIAVGIACLLVGVAVWPSTIHVHKSPVRESDVDSGFYVLRPVWRGPYPHTTSRELHRDAIEDERRTGSRWFARTLIVTHVDASEGAPYGWENVPIYPNPGWSEADIRRIRAHDGHYRCLHRHERTVGPFTNVVVNTPTYHAGAFTRLCTPMPDAG